VAKLRFSNEWVMHNKKKYLFEFGQIHAKSEHSKAGKCINLNTHIDYEEVFVP